MAFDLDPRSWDKVREALKEEDRFGRCSVGIDPDAIISQLRGLGAKGLHVRLPADLVPTFTLPVRFADTYEEGAVRVLARTTAPELVVRPDYLRLGVNADLRVTERADTSPRVRP
jgi:hypothetical protein